MCRRRRKCVSTLPRKMRTSSRCIGSDFLVHCRVSASHCLVGLLEGSVLLYLAAVELVPDRHQLLAGAGEFCAGKRVLVGFGAEFEDHVQPLVVSVLADRIVLNPSG